MGDEKSLTLEQIKKLFKDETGIYEISVVQIEELYDYLVSEGYIITDKLFAGHVRLVHLTAMFIPLEWMT